ncbi:hypothetical protein [Propionibacterium sp.]|uniref:hypothetical protein n=1 Tax=Propionibacterium sp. TaxID=1977903 RepID=UPI00345E692B
MRAGRPGGNEVVFGGDEAVMIGGPCAIESEEETVSLARRISAAVAKQVATMIGGTYVRYAEPWADAPQLTPIDSAHVRNASASTKRRGLGEPTTRHRRSTGTPPPMVVTHLEISGPRMSASVPWMPRPAISRAATTRLESS